MTPDLEDVENEGAPPILSRIKSATSQPSVNSPTNHNNPPWVGVTPKDKFRAAVRKVMVLRRGTSYLSGVGRVGAEPGVNPRRVSANLLYGHIRQDCVIEVIDYSSVRSSVGRMTNAEFVNLLNDPAASAREPWVKVRWVNIGGLSWDVIKAVSMKYDLHPLALEDVFHTRSQNRSKADYYTKHLFLRVLCHELGKSDAGSSSESAVQGSTLTGAPRSASPVPHRENRDLEKDLFREQEEGGPGIYEDETMARPSTKRRRRLLPLLPHSQRDVEGTVSTGGGSYPGLSRLMSGVSSASLSYNKQHSHVVIYRLLKNARHGSSTRSP